MAQEQIPTTYDPNNNMNFIGAALKQKILEPALQSWGRRRSFYTKSDMMMMRKLNIKAQFSYFL